MSAAPLYLGADQHTKDALELVGSKPLQRPEPLVCADSLAYVLFERPELDRQLAFLQDFGMLPASVGSEEIYLRGHGTSPWFYKAVKGSSARFLGTGFNLRSAADLERVAAETSTVIETCEGPGGGDRVRLYDPDGFIVDFVFGREESACISNRSEPFPINYPGHKNRVNQAVRSHASPTPIEKLGHVVLSVTDFETSSNWYLRHLGLIPSDVQCVSDGTPALAFCRFNRGEVCADHHSFVLVQNIGASLMHTAYEAMDIDSIAQGAQWLRSKGWNHFWGIGRHILGSQIFDYWKDPHGDEVEHYADGDVFTAEHPTRYQLLDRGGLWAWGHDLPPADTPGILTILRMLLTGRLRSIPPVMAQMRAAMALKPRPWLD